MFPPNFSFDLEDMSITQDSVSPYFKTPRSLSSIFSNASRISNFFSMFGNAVSSQLQGYVCGCSVPSRKVPVMRTGKAFTIYRNWLSSWKMCSIIAQNAIDDTEYS